MSSIATVTSRELAASAQPEEDDEEGALNEAGYSGGADQDIYDGKDVGVLRNSVYLFVQIIEKRYCCRLVEKRVFNIVNNRFDILFCRAVDDY